MKESFERKPGGLERRIMHSSSASLWLVVLCKLYRDEGKL